MGFSRRRHPGSYFVFLLLTILVLLAISSSRQATVYREISFEMNELDDIILTKSRIYIGNESSMIRTQLDQDPKFGNSDGFLSESEVEAFRDSYKDYFAQSEWIIMDEGYVTKRNATVFIQNLSGSTSDKSANISTVFTFHTQPLARVEQREHNLRFARELWKYVDLQGRGEYAQGNNFTLTAPEGWEITYSRGLSNHSYSNDFRTLKANADLDFEWITIIISTDVEAEPTNNGSDSGLLGDGIYFIIGVSVLAIVAVIIIAGRLKGRSRIDGGATTQEGDKIPLTDDEIKDLTQEKKRVHEEILEVRRQLRMDEISKDEAKSRERNLKERYREIDVSLKAQNRAKKGQ